MPNKPKKVIAISEHPIHVNSKSAKCELIFKKCNLKNIGHKYIMLSVWARNRCIIVSNMKAPSQTMLARGANKGKKQNGCHIKNICHMYQISDVHIQGAHVQMYARYEVFLIKPVARRTVHR